MPNLNPLDGPADFHQELLTIAADPRVRGLARRRVGDRDLAEDVIQEALFAVSRVKNPERIANLRAFFCKVVINEASRLRRAPGTIPLDDPEIALGARRGRGAAPRQLEDVAVAHLMAQTWLARFLEDKEKRRVDVPGRSPNPERYRDLIVTKAELVLRAAARGEVGEEDGNPALRAAYPEWFAEPGCAENSCHQRFSRARADLRALLQKVVPHDELLSLAGIRGPVRVVSA